jgi:uncharacterized protein
MSPDSELKTFQVMAKPSGPKCNLDCEYCFYLEKEKLYPSTNDFVMKYDILEEFIKQKIEGQETATVSFVWQGGEPTLPGVDFFRQVAGLQQKYANGKKIENAFQTNGILLDDEWCEFLSMNNFLVGISIDGPQYLHDKYRVLKGGQPTFQKVSGGIRLLKKHNVEFNTLTVVNRENSYHPLEVYSFLKESGSRYIQFIPAVERLSPKEKLQLVLPDYKGEAKVADWSVESEQYGNFLCEIFDDWVRNDVGEYFIQIFDVALESQLGMQQSLCVFNETCGKALAIEHNGDVYSCDHYVYPENKLGNMMDRPLESMVYSKQQAGFGLSKINSLPKYCRDCEVKYACNGECPKHRFIRTPEGEEGLNYLCAGYKKYFNHIEPYMKLMANELINKRPASNVMKAVRELSGIRIS